MKIKFSILTDVDLYESDVIDWPHSFFPKVGDSIIIEAFLDFGDDYDMADYVSKFMFEVTEILWSIEYVILGMEKSKNNQAQSG